MLASRLGLTAARALPRARPALTQPVTIAKRTIIPHYREKGIQYETSSEYEVDGVPIVSNRPTVPEELHPDPGMNGGYVNPARVNKAERDPYGKYWDQQGRRNWNEPVHEDEDILGRLSLHNYTYATPLFALKGWSIFVASILAITGGVWLVMPEIRPFAPREFPYNGLETELGGKLAVPAKPEES